jgi:uncharacterized surface protein with fasciclin (FAS1) repeats
MRKSKQEIHNKYGIDTIDNNQMIVYNYNQETYSRLPDHDAVLCMPAKETEMKDVIDTLLSDESFRTLIEALKSAELVETLKGPGPFTVFAPDDKAFTRLNLQEMMADGKKLVEMLTYHVVEKKLSEEELREIDCSPTLNGKTLAVKVKHGELFVDNGKVMKTDIECSNGVIHVIDSVFLPHLSGWYGDCGCC